MGARKEMRPERPRELTNTYKASTTTKKTLEYRDALQSRLAALALEGAPLDADQLLGSVYATVSPGSFHKTFSRDRSDLADVGIYLTETKYGRAKKWMLDRQKTLADVSLIQDENARIVAELARAAQTLPRTFQAFELGPAIARVSRGITGNVNKKRKLPCIPEVLQHLSEAIGVRRPCRMRYKSRVESTPSIRMFCPWGLFEQEGALYAVGTRIKGETLEVRTYNLARASEVEVLYEEQGYAIPDDFSVGDYRFLPFEFGEDSALPIQLYVRAKDAPLFLEKIRKRGTTKTQVDGSIIWQGFSRNLLRAARWAIEAAAIPIDPPELKNVWTLILMNARHDAESGSVAVPPSKEHNRTSLGDLNTSSRGGAYA